jgi:hypothetical protein
MQFQYGAPVPQSIVERPRCWGRSYDDATRECRGCGFQVSCKDEIIKMNVNRPVVPAYFQPSQPYTTPQPVQPVTYQQQAQRAPTLQQTIQQPQQVQRFYPLLEHYGWMQDPLYYHLSATPPPVRQQMQGESFVERVMKNAGLSMLEALFGQCFLAVRQMVFPPSRMPQQPPVIDTQTNPRQPQ